jgi:prepilin peptidase CpaA
VLIRSVILLVFPSLLALAGAYDLITMSIPNKLTLALAVCFALLSPFSGMGAIVAASHVACGVVVLIAGFLCFNGGLLGGGDAKLLAVSALWLGWERLPGFLFATLIFNTVMAVAVVRARSSAEATPCGAAIAAAGLLAYPYTQWIAGISPPA